MMLAGCYRSRGPDTRQPCWTFWRDGLLFEVFAPDRTISDGRKGAFGAEGPKLFVSLGLKCVLELNGR